ncbi:3',5'-cyclic-nucleotide phosphodiesterase [Pseudoalteromonas rubra]|uniref:3',5'-cyclic-nucleotide phosphodiesterase n=1 Tax=Pseudoalteromonas rubra TaxID=43658 RepID=A0A5S3WQH1_9GAMM|nr:metallophosphoesterase [Pseudoalteromonas rubra]TMP29648.1 3',5'-cyclic-nucleotide phosphodiesterase [Pseudoalteromonas rubra]TMP35241.1 3',5'-cyclic-nucleotide phosphodiesterase [Pseudoalteromonas rubra]
MAWFEQSHQFSGAELRLAHITDSHLFGTREGCYFEVNTAAHFSRVLDALAGEQLDGVVFGGDLTQDHSSASYALFAELLAQSALDCPLFWVPGNHDDLALLAQISEGQISAAKHLQCEQGDIVLLNSKGPTPAGWCDNTHLTELEAVLCDATRPVLAFCHHHPIPIDGYLDKHMLENGPQLLNTLVNSKRVEALIHGHVHNAYSQQYRGLPVYATPATSIQFTKHSMQWLQHNTGPAYRLVHWTAQGLHTEVKWLAN